MNTIEITEFEIGARLDKVLAAALEQYSRSSLEKLVLKGDVQVNGQIQKTKYKLKSDDVISVNLDEFNKQTPQIELPILFEDQNVVVLNKPAGVLTHAKGTLHNEATVATWLKQHVTGTETAAGFWESNRAGIVHRLDRGTSGVIICAKNEETQTFLQKQFANRNVKKSYLAVISNQLPEPEGLIDIPIERNPKKPATFRAGPNGKPAQTEFNVLVQGATHSLVELSPKTGRTHQLRVHLAYLKCPIVGDEIYLGETNARMLLHAHKLEITIPGGLRKTFIAETPDGFDQIV